MSILAGIALFALFSIVSIVVSGEESREYRDRFDNPLLWGPIGRR